MCLSIGRPVGVDRLSDGAPAGIADHSNSVPPGGQRCAVVAAALIAQIYREGGHDDIDYRKPHGTNEPLVRRLVIEKSKRLKRTLPPAGDVCLVSTAPNLHSNRI